MPKVRATQDSVDPIEQRVFLFVARRRAIKPDKLSASSRLNQDLGMDGDDAVAFFEKYQKEFHVDLSELTERWSEFFGPEGVSFVAVLVFLCCLGAAFLIGGALQDFIGLLPLWAWNSIIILCFLVGGIWWASRRKSAPCPITVGELVEAARSGKLELTSGGAAPSGSQSGKSGRLFA